jgi:hypothetical protein
LIGPSPLYIQAIRIDSSDEAFCQFSKSKSERGIS